MSTEIELSESVKDAATHPIIIGIEGSIVAVGLFPDLDPEVRERFLNQYEDRVLNPDSLDRARNPEGAEPVLINIALQGG